MNFNLPFCLSFSAKVIQLLKSLISGWSFGSLLSPAKTQNNSAAKEWIIAEIDCELYIHCNCKRLTKISEFVLCSGLIMGTPIMTF